MIIDEIMLKAATRMISVRIRNITLRSTRSALMNDRLRSSQSKARKPGAKSSAMTARNPAICCGALV